MDEELKEEILQLLREELRIEISNDGGDFYSRDRTITVKLILDGEQISEDAFTVKG